MIGSLQERFDAKYIPEPNSGCWLWEAALLDGRYGLIGRGGKFGGMALAHRTSFELHKGKIPDGLWVLHSCDNTFCVNPDHLFTGTHADNMTDMTNKGRSTFGERNPQAKLTAEKVAAIRKSKENLEDCACSFGVSQATVSNIRNGKSWKHA